MTAAASHGFQLIELVEDDLTFYARDHNIDDTAEDPKLQAAREVKALCDNLCVKPFVFQPFWFYEGLVDRSEHASRIAKLNLWMKLVKILDVQIVQIPTNWMTDGVTGDMEIMVRDLTEMAEIGLAQDPVVSFAYEGVAWGTYIDTWQGTWDVVRRVNKPNFGLCLDTYHIVARDWGDPTLPGCRRADGDESLTRSMDQLVAQVDVDKIIYVQLGDAELLEQPLVKDHSFHSDEQLPRMAWSRNARLFAWEEGENGCLPIDVVVDAIFKGLKYRGYVSMETFSRHLSNEDPKVPEMYAARAQTSWNETMKRIQ